MASCYYKYHINSSQHQSQQQKQQLPSNPMSLKTSATTFTDSKHQNRSAFNTVIKLKIPMSIQCTPKFGVPSKRTCLLEDRPVEKRVEDFMTLPKQKTFWETSCDLISNESRKEEQCYQHNNHLTISLSTASKTSPSISSNFLGQKQHSSPSKSGTSFSFESDDRDLLRSTTKLYPVTARLENTVF